ncbi:MAG: hypothetical protein ABWW69_06020 [Pyrodictiaceae archaeon]
MVEAGKNAISNEEKTKAKIYKVAVLVVIEEEWSETSGLREIEALATLTKPGAERAPSL